jgi:hypothetical protein
LSGCTIGSFTRRAQLHEWMSEWEYIASNSRVTGEYRIGNDMEGSGRGLVEILFKYLPEGTERNHENFTLRPIFEMKISRIRVAKPVCSILSLYGSTALCGLWSLFQFLNLYTQSVGLLGRGISPSQGRYLHTEQHKQQNKRTQTSMPRVGFEPTNWGFERAKIIQALDRTVTVISITTLNVSTYWALYKSIDFDQTWLSLYQN